MKALLIIAAAALAALIAWPPLSPNCRALKAAASDQHTSFTWTNRDAAQVKADADLFAAVCGWDSLGGWRWALSRPAPSNGSGLSRQGGI